MHAGPRLIITGIKLKQTVKQLFDKIIISTQHNRTVHRKYFL